jgi:xanthine phosphoribosyltransferase
MELLKQKILTDGYVLSSNVLKVDSFINHQIDVGLFNEIGKEFKRIYKDCEVTKILTIEASGIGIACMTAQYFDVPALFAKKHEAVNMDLETYESDVFSYTKNKTYKVRVSKKYLNENDKVLIVDDFLANGNAVAGLVDIVKQAGAEVVGVGIVIEKGFQTGRSVIEKSGIRVESLVIVDSLENGQVTFKD